MVNEIDCYLMKLMSKSRLGILHNVITRHAHALLYFRHFRICGRGRKIVILVIANTYERTLVMLYSFCTCTPQEQWFVP